MADPWGEERESLVGHINATHRTYRRAAEWCAQLAREAYQTGCHLAAVKTAMRTERAWKEAEEALEDFEYERDRPHIEAHRLMVENLLVARSLARMDHVLGPGWLKEAAE